MKDANRVQNDIAARLDESRDSLVDFVEADNGLAEAKKQLKAAQAEWKKADAAWKVAVDGDDKKLVNKLEAQKRALTNTIQHYMDQIKKLQG